MNGTCVRSGVQSETDILIQLIRGLMRALVACKYLYILIHGKYL